MKKVDKLMQSPKDTPENHEPCKFPVFDEKILLNFGGRLLLE